MPPRDAARVWTPYEHQFFHDMRQWLTHDPNRHAATDEDKAMVLELARALANHLLGWSDDARDAHEFIGGWYDMHRQPWTPPVVIEHPADPINGPLLFALVWLEVCHNDKGVSDRSEDLPIRVYMEEGQRRVCPNPDLATTRSVYNRLRTESPEDARHALYHAMFRRFGLAINRNRVPTDDRHFVCGPSDDYPEADGPDLEVPIHRHPLSPLDAISPIIADGASWVMAWYRYLFLRFSYLAVLGPESIRRVAGYAAITFRHATRMTLSCMFAWWRFVFHVNRRLNDQQLDAGWWNKADGRLEPHRTSIGFMALFCTMVHVFQQNPGLFIRMVPVMDHVVSWPVGQVFDIPTEMYSRAVTFALHEVLRQPSDLVRGAVALLRSIPRPVEMVDPGLDPAQWPVTLEGWHEPLEVLHLSPIERGPWMFAAWRAFSRSVSFQSLTTHVINWIRAAGPSPPISPIEDQPGPSGYRPPNPTTTNDGPKTKKDKSKRAKRAEDDSKKSKKGKKRPNPPKSDAQGTDPADDDLADTPDQSGTPRAPAKKRRRRGDSPDDAAL